MRIKIAEACGWYQSSVYRLGENGKRIYYWRRVEHRGSSDPRKRERLYLPNYPNDLNAMAEAEARLTEKERLRYLVKLVSVVGRGRDSNIAGNINAAVFATAAQRAEAFLRTLGKWTDD